MFLAPCTFGFAWITLAKSSRYRGHNRKISISKSVTLKGVTMKLKTILFSILILTGLLMSAFGSPAAIHTISFQATATPLAITVVPPTVVVITTPGVVPVTGGETPTGLWTLVLFGLLALLGIAFLVALFSPRTTREDIDRNPPPPDL